MKNKSIISLIIIFTLFFSIMPIQATLVQAANSIEPSLVCGVWEGTYSGYENSSIIERSLRLDIDNCTEDGTVEGFATIDSGDNGKYFFKGNLNLQTGEISFKGDEWLYNPSDFSFASFSGVLETETLTMSGNVDGESNKTFSLEKKSESFQSLSINTASMKVDYSGEYDGHHNGTTVRRNIEIHIQDISNEGSISGTVVISPSSKASATYGVNGSYYFKGSINERNGKIALQGYEWIDYPVQHDNFTFVALNGYIDSANGVIIGTSEDGIWAMEVIDYNTIDNESGFTLGKDNNSFIHTNSQTWNGAGFKGVTNYSLDSSYFEKLTKNSSKSEKNKIKKAMKENWGGSCYGIAMSMGLLYEDYIDIKDLTDSKSASNYHSMPYPADDSKLLNMITYYQLSQNLENGGKKTSAVSAAFNNYIFTGLINWLCNYDSLSVFLRNLVNYSSSGHVELLGFSTREGGHAVLVTGCEYDSDKEQYVVEIYDENSVNSATSLGEFSYMTIEKDFSAFSYTDSNGDKITNKSFLSIYFLDWNSLGNIMSTATKTSSGHAKLDFLLGDDFKAINDNGKYIQYKNNEFMGDMNIYSFDTVDADNGTHIIIETDKTDKLILSDIGNEVNVEVYDDSQFLALDGVNISGAVMDLGDGIKISGDEYSFKAYISTDEIQDDEDGLVSVSAKASADTTILKNNNDIVVSSANILTDIKSENYSGTDVDVTTYSNGSEVSVKTDEIFSSKTNIKTAKVTLQKSVYTYDGKKKQPTVTVKIGNTILTKNVQYKVTYNNNKSIGKASITITGIGNYEGTVTQKFTIVPKGTSVLKLLAKKKEVVVSWKKQAKNTSGYQIQYSTSKKFTSKTTKTKTITKTKNTKVTISKLKGKKKYYVRIRTYKTVKGKKYYSLWSKAKTVTTKK